MGVGGMGMVTLAGLFGQKGWKVRGSDQNVYPPASTELALLKVEVREGFRKENLSPKPDLVVVGNVISRGNPEAEALLTSDIPYVSMPQALTENFLLDRESLVVTGTHGKTTTTSLLAWILAEAGQDPGLFVGGVPGNFGQGYRLGSGKPFVIEGDEYDTAFFEKTPKFLHYRPTDIILTSIEFDHADIYRDLDHVLSQFHRLLEILSPQAQVVACADYGTVLDLCRERNPKNLQLYGLSPQAHWRAENVVVTESGTRFEVVHRGKKWGSVDSPMLGHHNVNNALACLVLAAARGISPETVIQAISTFKGVKRRQEKIGESQGIVLYDDFAHHPTAIGATLAAFRKMAQVRRGKLWAVLEPRSNTLRRKIFQNELPQSLGLADRILLAPVYQKKDSLAAEERLDPKAVIEHLQSQGKDAQACQDGQDILNTIVRDAQKNDVVVFMSNGSFGEIPRKVFKALEG